MPSFFQQLETQHQEPSGDPGVTSQVTAQSDGTSVQQVTPDTTPIDQTQVTQTDVTPQQADKLYAGKYKSPEELEQAYNSTSGEASRMAQQMKQLEGKLRQLTQSQGPQQPQRSPEEVNRDFLVAFSQDPVGTLRGMLQQEVIQPIQSSMRGMNAEQTVSHMASKPEQFPLFNEMRDQMADILDSMPELENSKNPILAAYNIAKGLNVEKFVKMASEQKAVIDKNNNQDLTNATTTPGSKGTQARSGNSTPQTIADSIRQGILNVRDPVTDFLTR
jgi:hypothetical protein